MLCVWIPFKTSHRLFKHIGTNTRIGSGSIIYLSLSFFVPVKTSSHSNICLADILHRVTAHCLSPPLPTMDLQAATKLQQWGPVAGVGKNPSQDLPHFQLSLLFCFRWVPPTRVLHVSFLPFSTHLVLIPFHLIFLSSLHVLYCSLIFHNSCLVSLGGLFLLVIPWRERGRKGREEGRRQRRRRGKRKWNTERAGS